MGAIDFYTVLIYNRFRIINNDCKQYFFIFHVIKIQKYSYKYIYCPDGVVIYVYKRVTLGKTSKIRQKFLLKEKYENRPSCLKGRFFGVLSCQLTEQGSIPVLKPFARFGKN